MYRPSQIHCLEEFYRLLPTVSEPVGVVSIEELHASPRSSMERVARFMNVPFTPTMLESTIGGLKWWGSHYTRVHGFSPELHRDVRAERVGAHDVAAVMKTTGRLLRHLGYSTAPLSAFDAVRAYIPGVRYVADVSTLVRVTARRERSLRARLACAGIGLTRAVKYLVGRVVLEGPAIRRLATLDARSDFSKLQVLNPLEPGSVLS